MRVRKRGIKGGLQVSEMPLPDVGGGEVFWREQEDYRCCFEAEALGLA